MSARAECFPSVESMWEYFSVFFRSCQGFAGVNAKSVHSTLNRAASKLACFSKSTLYAWIPLSKWEEFLSESELFPPK